MSTLVEKRSLQYSVAMHFGVLLIAAFGLPALLPDRPDPEPMVMTVEILPISAMTNVRPSEKPIVKAQEKPKPPPPKPIPPKPVPQPPKEKAQPMEKVFDPMAEPEKKKEEKKDKPEEDDFKKLMEQLNTEAKTAPNEKAVPEENKTMSQAPFDESQPLSLSEKDAIRNQFIPCWSPPVGAKDAGNLIVKVQAQYKQDGTLIDSQIATDQQSRYASDPFFRAAADAALRATHNPTCNPLKNLNPDKYGSWKDMELTFDPAFLQ